MADEREPRAEDEEPDWIDRVVVLGARFGLNEVRLRWRLMGWVEAWEARRYASRHAVEHALYENKVCPFCGALNDQAEVACHICEEHLPSHRWQVLARLGLVSPIGWTVSSLVALAHALVYLRMAWASGAWAAPGFQALLLAGAGYTDLVLAGEWWRMLTAPWVALTLARLAAGVVGLVQIGPLLERYFGRARVLGLMGALAAASSAATIHGGGHGLFAGLEGVVLGMAVFGALWGHREGTRPGTELRAAVLWWGVAYAVVAWLVLPYFDRFYHVGLVPMLAGAATGALLGAVVPVRAMLRDGSPALARALGLVGLLLVVGAFLVLARPPVTAAALLVADQVGT